MADQSTPPGTGRGPLPAAPHGVAVVEHAHHHPRLQHHFYSMEQQLEASSEPAYLQSAFIHGIKRMNARFTPR